ncbi:hypothetical protein [Pseudomonas peli]|uniref:hypothetical protein n=1 Tax=Pseudomonas peli TaxID=592361 RepID=UPI003D153BC8
MPEYRCIHVCLFQNIRGLGGHYQPVRPAVEQRGIVSKLGLAHASPFAFLLLRSALALTGLV